MRMTAPVVGGVAIALAVVFVWYVRAPLERSVELDDAAALPPADAGRDDIARPHLDESPAAESPATASSVEPPATVLPVPERSPLPGEAPATPMTQLLTETQQNMIVRNTPGEIGIPPQLAEGEREFAAEPVDSTWAPGAQVELLGRFAEMQGLKVIDLQVECRSTMCRVQVTQPPLAPGPGNGQPFDILRNDFGFKPRWMMTIGGGPPGVPPGPVRSIAYLWREGFAPENPASAQHETR